MENLGNLEDSGRCGNTGAIQDMSWPDSLGTNVNPAAIDALLRSVRQPRVDLVSLGAEGQETEVVVGASQGGEGKKGTRTRRPAPRFSPSSAGRARGRGRGRGGR